MHVFLQEWRVWCFLILLVGMILVYVCESEISSAAYGRCFDTPEELPKCSVAVVLGTSSHFSDGRVNLFFLPRIEAAARLYQAGKVNALIVSGDNSRPDYDEPTEMKHLLVGMGVPAEKISCDYAGFRTLDSVERARGVFGQTEVIFVSQRFHNQRAIYLGLSSGMQPYGLNARDVLSWKIFLRERLARIKAVLDIHVLQRGAPTRSSNEVLKRARSWNEKIDAPAFPPS